MRGFISLLFAAALAAHIGPAGAPSLGGAPICADGIGAGAHLGDHVLHPAPVLGANQAEATTDGREPTRGPDPRRPLPSGPATASSVSGDGAPGGPRAFTRASLLGFVGHPTTAPPLQA